jgi:Predicted dehydrogenases and related proteins
MLNVAVIGCGYWGPNLIRNFHFLPDCKVKKVCDLDSRRLVHMQKLFCEIETTTNIDDVFNDSQIDAVAIATPVRYHFEMAKKCLQAKKHTLIEKPMASSSVECKKLIELAQKHNCVLMVGHTYIYSSPVRKIKEIYNSGELGKLFYISSRRLNLGLFQTDINVVWDLAPHDISIILSVLDAPPVSLNCQGKANVHPPIEDISNLTIDFDNGGFATIRNSWLDPCKVREMTFVGTRQMLVYNDLEPIEKIKIFDKRVENPPYYDTFAEFQYSYHYGDVYSPYLKQSEPLKVECQHFLDCIKNNVRPDTDGLGGFGSRSNS